jgi:hypothetical protein
VSRWLLNRVLRALWPLYRRGLPELCAPAPEAEPVWTPDMQQKLLAFLRTPTGAQLLVVLRQKEEILKSIACDGEQRRVDHARGRAVGYHEALASLIVLSAPPPPQEEEKPANSPDGDAEEIRAQLSHQ